MSTVMTRFELQLIQFDPNVDRVSWNAVNTFLDNLGTLCNFVVVEQPVFNNHNIQDWNIVVWVVYGLLTTAQNSTALGFLNTLNTTLVANGKQPTICISWQVTSQP